MDCQIAANGMEVAHVLDKLVEIKADARKGEVAFRRHTLDRQHDPVQPGLDQLLVEVGFQLRSVAGGFHPLDPGLGLGEAHHIVEVTTEEHTSELQSLMRFSYGVVCY